MKKLIITGLLIFATGCACDIQSVTDANTAIATGQVCEPIYGRADDWNVISDDLARNIYRHNRICEAIKN